MSSQARLGEAPIYLGRYWKQTNLHALDTDPNRTLQGIELQIKSFTHHYSNLKREAEILSDLTVWILV